MVCLTTYRYVFPAVALSMNPKGANYVQFISKVRFSKATSKLMLSQCKYLIIWGHWVLNIKHMGLIFMFWVFKYMNISKCACVCV